MSAREDAIAGIMARTGKTREQAEAFLAVLGSAMAKRGIWPDAPVLTDDETGAAFDAFIGSAPGAPSLSTKETEK